MVLDHPSPAKWQTLRGVIGALYQAFTGAYALSVCGLLLLRLISPENSLILLFSTFLHLLLLPALVLIPISLLLRRWLLCGLLLPIVAVTANGYGPQFLPHNPPTANDAITLDTITLMTFNLFERVEDPQGFIELIRETNADLVALQELNSTTAAAIDANLRDLYPYMALNPVPENPVVGQGFLSRYPVTGAQFWRTVRGHQRIRIEIDGQTLIVYNTHLVNPLTSRDWEQHTADVQQLLDRAAQETAPLIIAGDFNMTPWQPNYERMRQHLDDAFYSAGQGFGFTFNPLSIAHLALARIDYVFYGQGIDVLDARVLPRKAESDHHPLLVELRLSPAN